MLGFESAHSLISVFAGVNAGYRGERFTVTDAAEAVVIVSKVLKDINLMADVYPGRVVYPVEAGCPADGEVIAAIFLKPEQAASIEMFETLKGHLGQTSLSIVVPGELLSALPAIRTEGVFARLPGRNLEALATKWQRHASAVKMANGVYVTGAIYQVADGTIYMQAEANPSQASSGYVSNIPAWKDATLALVQHFDARCVPVFRSVGFSYLRTLSPDL